MKTNIVIRLQTVAAAIFAALMTMVALPGSRGHAAAATYQLVENWAQLPQGMKWSQATGVAIDAHGTIYVHHRHYAMPIIAFDGNGRFLRAWGRGVFSSPHSLRTDPNGNIWVTDVGSHQIVKCSADGTILMTLGQKGIAGDNESKDAFNRPADVVIAKDGGIFIADGEETTSNRVVHYSHEGKFVKYWGGNGKEPGKFYDPHSIAMDSRGRLYVADRMNFRIQIFDQDGKYLDQWTHLGAPSPFGLFITSDDMLYVVDGINRLFIANTSDGRIVDRIAGLTNPHAVTVDNKGTIYIAEITGTSVKKFVKK